MSNRQPDNDIAARVAEGWRLQRLGHHAQAETIYRAVLQQQPENAIAWHNLGLIAVQAGATDAAIDLFRQAVTHEPDNPRFLTNLAQTLRGAGQLEAAISVASKAIAQSGDFANAFQCRALAHQGLARHAEAVADFERAIALGLVHPEVHSQHGQSLAALNRHNEALAAFDAAVQRRPDFADALNYRSIALFQLCRYDDALADCTAAIRLRDDVPSYWNNRGNVLVVIGRFDDALLDFDRAITLKPDYPDPYVNKGIALLQLGNFEHGWFYFEWRWKREAAKDQRKFKQPLWLGKTEIRGKTIFLHSEQGFGDTIQFFRYAALVRQMGAKVLLGVQQPLKSLIQHALPDIAVYAEGEVIPPFDLQCPLMSLPLACATRTLDDIPPSPKLAAPEPIRQAWADRLGPKSRLRVGLVWQGNPGHLNDHNRSMPLEALAPLIALDADFTCLQKSISAEDGQTLQDWGVASFAEDLTDFTATAGLIEALDLVISVDTSLAHLAGAMGKEVWLLQPKNPDFRWLLCRDDSPWYPSLRMFRQAEQGGWEAVVAEVKQTLTMRGEKAVYFSRGSYNTPCYR